MSVFFITPNDLSTTSRGHCSISMVAKVGGSVCDIMGSSMAQYMNTRMYTIGYRMPPDHPYPAALDHCLSAYRALLEQYKPAEIVFSGSSAGGNLAAELMLRARDEGLPLSAGVVLLLPEVDLTESGDGFNINRDSESPRGDSLGSGPSGSLWV